MGLQISNFGGGNNSNRNGAPVPVVRPKHRSSSAVAIKRPELNRAVRQKLEYMPQLGIMGGTSQRFNEAPSTKKRPLGQLRKSSLVAKNSARGVSSSNNLPDLNFGARSNSLGTV